MIVQGGSGLRKGMSKTTYKHVKKVLATKQYVKKAIANEQEKKYNEIALQGAFTSCSTTWTEVDLCNLAQGDGESERIGRKIRIHSLEIKGVLQGGQTQTEFDDSHDTVRMVIALWNGQGLTPLATAVTTIDHKIALDAHTRGRLEKIYYDKYHFLASNGTSMAGYIGAGKVIKYYKKFKHPITITFGDDTQTYPDKRLMMVLITDSSGLPHPGFTFGYILVRYTDE